MGRERAAGLYYLACPKIQNIKDVLALFSIIRLGIVSMHGTYVGGKHCLSWVDGQGDHRHTSGRSGHKAGMRTCSS